VQNIGLLLVPSWIGYVLDKWCITGQVIRTVDGVQKAVNQYDYTIPMLIFTLIAFISVIFAFLLKAENRKKGYGLEKANMK